jgi:hypothetical protein
MNHNSEERYQWRTGQSWTPRAPKLSASALGVLVAALATIALLTLHGCGGSSPVAEKRHRDASKQILDAMHKDASEEMRRYNDQQMQPVKRVVRREQ